MQAPRLPSFFKSPNIRKFNFPNRYYDERKERIQNLKKREISKIKFKTNRISETKTNRSKKLLFIIIVLTLATYLILK
tara:strand:- start:740 stop:973 length:234 start_codon:yes stop_codon:yes gene_type:complete